MSCARGRWHKFSAFIGYLQMGTCADDFSVGRDDCGSISLREEMPEHGAMAVIAKVQFKTGQVTLTLHCFCLGRHRHLQTPDQRGSNVPWTKAVACK